MWWTSTAGKKKTSMPGGEDEMYIFNSLGLFYGEEVNESNNRRVP